MAEIKEATLRLSEQVTSKAHPPQEGGAAPPPASASLGSSQPACSSEVTRLIEERDALLQTGEGEGLRCAEVLVCGEVMAIVATRMRMQVVTG